MDPRHGDPLRPPETDGTPRIVVVHHDYPRKPAPLAGFALTAITGALVGFLVGLAVGLLRP